jgi:hypothetical protein
MEYKNKILNITHSSDITLLFTIYLSYQHDKSFVNYMMQKYGDRIRITTNFFVDNYDYIINASIYNSDQDYELIKNYKTLFKCPVFFICHDYAKRLTHFENVWFTIPKAQKYVCFDILPFAIDAKIPNKFEIPPIYIIQGAINRRCLDLVNHILTHCNTHYFLIKLIGHCTYIDQEFRNYKDILSDKRVRFYFNLNFEDYHKHFLNAYCIFTCITPEKQPAYYSNKLTSSVNYAIGYNKYLMMDTTLYNNMYKSTTFNMPCDKILLYNDDTDLHNIFTKSLINYYDLKI